MTAGAGHRDGRPAAPYSRGVSTPPHEPDAWSRALLQRVDADQLQRGDLYPCPYLAGQQARMRAFRTDRLPGETYHELMDRGFRRSGDVFYAMDCPGCTGCVPIRVPTSTFAPSRSQRRAWRRNADVTMRVQRPQLDETKWRLYRRYVAFQHGRHEEEGPEALAESLYADVVDTVEVTYHTGDELLAVTILDVCSRSVSSVYHFFAPEHARRSLGVFSVLAEIDWAKRVGVPWYYLGYWIEGAPTMHYKADYRPHELLRDGAWRAGGDPPTSPRP